jgi:hypothetical protein
MRVAKDLAELARTFASIVERIADEGEGSGGGGEGPESSWVDQHQSDLTVRQHCRAVRRRRTEGKPGAAIVGRRYLMTRAALWEEMGQSPKPGLRKCGARNGSAATPTPSRHDTVAEATAARLRQIRQGK